MKLCECLNCGREFTENMIGHYCDKCDKPLDTENKDYKEGVLK